MTDNVTQLPQLPQLPQPGVILDLDIAERPSKDIKPPFIVTVAGKQLTLTDPSEIDWRDLASVEMPADLLRVAMSPDDRQHLVAQELPGWKFNRLMESYYTHYDLEDKIREAKRQASFAGL